MKIEKIIKKLGPDTQGELDSMAEADLKARIVLAEQSMKEVQDELEANAQYQALKESLSAITTGKKEVNSRQKAIIQYCLHRLAQ